MKDQYLNEIGDIFDNTVAYMILDDNQMKRYIKLFVYRRRALNFASDSLSTHTHPLTTSDMCEVALDSFAKAGLVL
jgi:hypothetical protein